MPCSRTGCPNRISGYKREEGGSRKLHVEKFHNFVATLFTKHRDPTNEKEMRGEG
jgi:hypothetical protein